MVSPENPKTNTLITLYVNTEIPDLSQGNIEKHVWMGDSNRDIDNNHGGKIADYLTKVLSNGTVTWIPAVLNISKTPSDYVLLTDVVISGSNANRITISQEPTKKQPTYVNGKISKIKGGDSFKYNIHFTVYRDGQKELPLYVDPRMQIQ